MKTLEEIIKENKEADAKARRKKVYLDNLYYETIEDAVKDGVL